jgi:hypothetical protein
MLPRPGVVNLEGEEAVDHSPVDVYPIERGILRMLDGVHERFRNRRQNCEDLVLGRAVLAEPDADSPSQSGGTLRLCLEPKLKRGGFWATHLSLPYRRILVRGIAIRRRSKTCAEHTHQVRAENRYLVVDGQSHGLCRVRQSRLQELGECGEDVAGAPGISDPNRDETAARAVVDLEFRMERIERPGYGQP